RMKKLRCQREKGRRSRRPTSSADLSALPFIAFPQCPRARTRPLARARAAGVNRQSRGPARHRGCRATVLEMRGRSPLGFGPRGTASVIIDVFNHFVPQAYFERLHQLIPDHPATTAFPRLRTLWDLDARLRLLDQFGDYAQVLSLANPPL